MENEASNLALAIETLAAFMGYLNTVRLVEKHTEAPSARKITALTIQLDVVADERERLSTNPALIDKVLYVYAPLLRAARQAGLLNTDGLNDAIDTELSA